jgi:hypothetical protein
MRLAVDATVDVAQQIRPVLVDIGPQPSSALDQSFLLVCTAPRPGDVHPTETLRALGLDDPSGRRFAAVTESGVLLAEVEGDGRRTFAVVVPDSDPQLADQMTWIVAGPDLGSLLRYAVHAAKLRYQVGVFRTVLPELRAREKRLDDTLEELFRLHASLEGEHGRLNRSLIDAHSRLGRAQGESAGLAVMGSRLKELARSTEAALHNLEAHAPRIVRSPGPTGLTSFDRDRALGTWLRGQVEQELGYLESSRERMLEAQRLTALRIEQAKNEQARLSNWLTVIQTSVLGAVVGCLTAIQALDLPFTPRPELQWAVLVSVPVLALLLPPLALRWVVGVGSIDAFAGALCGAVLGWTIAVAANAGMTIVGAAVGIGGVLGAALLRRRRRRQGPDRDRARHRRTHGSTVPGGRSRSP